MKMRTLVLAGFGFAAALCLADEVKPVSKDAVNDASVPLTKEQRYRRRMMMTGGFVRDTRKQHGRVVLVDCQSAADAKWISNAASVIANNLRITVDVERGEFDLMNPKCRAEATVFIVDDKKLPMSLIAPETRWSMLNVGKLKAAKRSYFETRTMKAITRAVVPLLGGADSQYPCCLMGNVLKPEDFDKFPTSQLPVDVVARMEKNMEGLGIGQWRDVFYREACQQGWAAEPTNEFQKAIWEKTHEIPAQPMKIEFDPKKGR